MNLVAHALTPIYNVTGIRSLLRVGTVVAARVLTVLYPLYNKYEASPKAISGRTSYLQI